MKKKLMKALFGFAVVSAFALYGNHAMAASPVTDIQVKCSVHSDGEKLEQIKITVEDPSLFSGLTANDFTLKGTAHDWSSEKDLGFQTEEVHDFTASVDSITIDENTLTLNLSNFSEKYFYVDSFTVTCEKTPELSFSDEEITAESTAVADEFEHLTKDFDGQTSLSYNLFTPDDTSVPQPLVLALHGSGDQMNTKANRVVTAWAEPALQEKHPAYVLAPVFHDQDPDLAPVILEQTISVIKDLVEEGKVDSNRIYVTGKSMGGGNTVKAAITYSDLFAAALPLCPSASSLDGYDVSNLSDMPVWFVQGTEDMAVPIEGTRDMYNTLLDEGSYKVKMKEYSHEEMAARGIADDKHHDVEIVSLEDERYSDWLFSQSKEPVSPAIDYIRLNCSVPAAGQAMDSLEIYVNDASILDGLTKDDFSLNGKAYTWGSSADNGYRSNETHDFSATVSDINIDGNLLTLEINDFAEKYFYVDDFEVTCSANEDLSFSQDDVRDTITAVADDFNQYSADYAADFDYNLYAPETNGEAVPLVLVLHGSGDQENLLANRLAEAYASPKNQTERKAFVLAPVFKDQNYESLITNLDRSVELIRKLIDLGMANPNRIYVTGKSMGGMNTDRIYTKYPDLFAAAMPLCGGFPDDVKGIVDNIKDKPIYILQGDGDPAGNGTLYPGSVNLYNTLKELGNEEALLHVFSLDEINAAGIGNHDIEMLAMETPEFMEWLFAQSL